MIWRLSMASLDGHEGYAYFQSKSEAMQYVRDKLSTYITEAEYFKTRGAQLENRGAHWSLESFFTPKNKVQMVGLLQRWGSHADNG